MATRRKAVNRSRITTRSSKAKQPEQEAATTASQTSTITNTTTRLIVSDPCSPSPVKKSAEIKNEEEHDDDDGCWSTPKAKRFRIPEIESCPPAPKKQRGACDDASINCSMRRSSIPFFTPPELADFFIRVSVPNMSAA